MEQKCKREAGVMGIRGGGDLGSRRIEVVDQELHVLLQLAAPQQVVHVTLDGHVVQSKQAGEHNAVSLPQL